MDRMALWALSFVVFIVLVIGLFNILFWNQVKRLKEQNRHTTSKYAPSEDDPPKFIGHAIAAHLHAIGNYLRSQNNQQDRQDHRRERREWITIMALIGAGVFAGASDVILFVQLRDARDAATGQIAQMTAQTNAMSGQLNEMKSEQRPWVSVSIEDTPIVTIAPKRSSVGINFVLNNVGHTVALGAVSNFSADGDYNGTGRAITNPCLGRRGMYDVQDAKTLFPGEVYTTRRYQILFGGWDLQHSVAPAGVVPPRLVVNVSGCVTYTYEGSTTKHHTPFISRIYGSEYRPGEPIGFPIENYGDVLPTIKPVNIYLDGVNPD